MLQTTFRPSCMNRASVFELHKRFKEGRESVRNDERCGRSKEVNTPELIGQRVRVRVTMLRFRKRFHRKRPALFKSGQWHFHQDNAPILNSILVTDYLSKMGIKTVPQPPYSPDLTSCDFWLFSKLKGCRYERIDETKEAVTKVIDTLTQEEFHGAFQKLLEGYKCIAAGGDSFEGDLSFMCVLSIKVPIRKNLETYLMTLVHAYRYIHTHKHIDIRIFFLHDDDDDVVLILQSPLSLSLALFLSFISSGRSSELLICV